MIISNIIIFEIDLFRLSIKKRAEYKASVPLQRFGTPEDVAQMVIFLASPKTSGFVTGSVFDINGGLY